MKIFHLPDLGEGLPDAEVREWYVKEGDEVKVDQPVVAMETAKAVVDVPAPQSGKIVKLHGKPGDIIQTGAPLIEFECDEETEQAKGTVVGNVPVGTEILREAATGIKQQSNQGGIKAMPAVRALAKKLNVDLEKIMATGPNGQITLDDVEKAAGGVVAETNQVSTEIQPGYEAVRGVRRAMAATMAQSHREVAPITLMDDADIQAWSAGNDITLRVIRAIVTACKVEPSLNTWFDNKAMARKLFSEVHLGIAMDSAEGLFVPVLRDAHQQSSSEQRATINRFKEEVKARTIPADDLKGATIILSNVGIFAGKYASPMIVPPTVAILATGKIREMAVVSEGKVAAHRIIPLSLTIDHRAVTGGEAARFLATVIEDLAKVD